MNGAPVPWRCRDISSKYSSFSVSGVRHNRAWYVSNTIMRRSNEGIPNNMPIVANGSRFLTRTKHSSCEFSKRACREDKFGASWCPITKIKLVPHVDLPYQGVTLQIIHGYCNPYRSYTLPGMYGDLSATTRLPREIFVSFLRPWHQYCHLCSSHL